MASSSFYSKRIHALRQCLPTHTTVIIRNFDPQLDPHFNRLTGMPESDAWLVLSPKSIQPILLCNSLEYEEIRHHAGFRVIKMEKGSDYANWIKKNTTSTLAINGSFYPYARVQELKKWGKKIMDISTPLGGLRSIKDKPEIKSIKEAYHITRDTLDDFSKKKLYAHLTEIEAKKWLDNQLRKNGATGLAFDTIVAFGKNAAIPHHVSNSTKLKANQCVLVDLGAMKDHYCGDMTRTYFHGKPSTEFTRAYQAVYHAHQQGAHAIKPGVEFSKPFLIAQEIVKQNGFPAFPHGLGHGLGLYTHDFPISMNASRIGTFAPNQVWTVEPGIYLAGKFGIRLEDDGIVTQNGFKLFGKPQKSIPSI